MPPVVVAVAAAAASFGGVAAAGALGFAATSFGATLIGSAAALAVSTAGNAIFAKKGAKSSMSQVARDRTVSVRQPISPRQIVYGNVKIGGTIVYLQSTDNNKYLHLVIALAGHELNAITGIYFDDTALSLDGSGDVIGGTFAGKARIIKYLGTTSQTADAALIAASGGKWTSAHRGQGVAYLYVRLEWDANVYTSGIPNITATVEGKKVYDPRTTTTAYSNNAALCIRDYLLTTVKDGGVGATSAELDATNWTAAANLCDELVPIVGTGTTEKRYMLNGTIALSDSNTPKGTLEALLTSCGGTLVYAGGKWRLLAAAYRTPTVTLSESDLRGGIQLTTRVSRREQYNAVKGTFISPDSKWQPTDYPAIVSATAMAEDGGERIFREIDRPFTTSAPTAQRLGKIELLRGRQPLTVQMPCKLTAFRVQAGDVINVTNTRFGWTAKPFEVREWQFAVTDDGMLGIDLSLRETDGSIYDWSTSEEQEVDPAPNTDLPSAFATAAPTGVTVTPTAVIAADGTTQPALAVSWTAPVDAFLIEYEVQWRASTDVDFNSVMLRSNRYVIPQVKPGVTYVVRVRAINTLGFRSPFASASDTAAVPDTVAPGVCTGVAALGGVRNITVTWTPPADKDVRHIEIWENTTDNRAGAYNVGVTDARHFSRMALSPNVTRWYWVRAVDTTGNTGDWNALGGVSATTSLLLASDLEDAIINTAKFATGIAAVEIVGALPSTGNYQGRQAFLTTDNKLYRHTGVDWTKVIDAVDLPDGSIGAVKIGDLQIDTPKLAANAITADKISAGAITAGKIAADAVTAGTVAAGAISTTELAAGAVNAAKLAATELITLNAQLGTAVVGTLNVLDGAINGVKIEDLAASNSVGSTAVNTASLGVAMTVTGKPVTIMANWLYNLGSASAGTTNRTIPVDIVSSGVTLLTGVESSSVDSDAAGTCVGSVVYTFTPSAGAKDFYITGPSPGFLGNRLSIWVIENRK